MYPDAISRVGPSMLSALKICTYLQPYTYLQPSLNLETNTRKQKSFEVVTHYLLNSQTR